ncbi:hypothetical protein LENED_011784 [Lentinula edodes]|uniref:Uncharacterized protein n=1 Tax=Lentinula edodes TaxID=5353 RepID=A0A1Q3EQY4_LENED|nr:hypothetical protein LENED_011784 [Lentinula edodes]
MPRIRRKDLRSTERMIIPILRRCSRLCLRLQRISLFHQMRTYRGPKYTTAVVENTNSPQMSRALPVRIRYFPRVTGKYTTLHLPHHFIESCLPTRVLG